MIYLMLRQCNKMKYERDDSHWEHLRCMTNILMEYCIRENVKFVKEFDDDEVLKVEIDNTDLDGSYCFHDEDILPFEGQKNGYVGVYRVIVFKMFMLVLMGFMRFFWYHDSIKKIYSITS